MKNMAYFLYKKYYLISVSKPFFTVRRREPNFYGRRDHKYQTIILQNAKSLIIFKDFVVKLWSKDKDKDL